MAVRDIKTSIELGGEKEFEQQLRDISRELRVTDSEMKALKSGFDLTDDQMGNLSRQSQLTKDKLAQQREVVAGLEREVSVLADSYGDGSREVQAMSIRLNNARDRMNRFEKESEAADRALEEFGRDSIKAGRQIENGIGDAAEDATRSLNDMVSKLKSGVDSIRGSAALSVAMDIGGQVIDFVSGVNDFTESTREYNRQLSFLEQNARTYGLEMDFVKSQMYEVTAITGETDSAIEGLSNLMAAGFDSREIELAVDGLAGAVIKFPDTLKFESLADGLQETLATASATGAYAELLERMGVSLDDFNADMVAATSKEGRQQVALAYLRGDLQTVNNEYTNTNADLIAAAESSANLENAFGELGRTLETWLTPGRNAFAEFLRDINNTLLGIQQNAKGASSVLDVFMPSSSSAGDLADAYIYNRDQLAGSYEGGKIPEQTMQQIYSDLMTTDRLKLVSADDPIHQYGVETGLSFAEGVNEGIEATAENSAETLKKAGEGLGGGVGLGMAEGLAGQTDLVVAETENMVERINAATAGVNDVVIPVRYGPVVTTTPTGSTGTTEAVVNLDGRKVGTAILPVIDQSLASVRGIWR